MQRRTRLGSERKREGWREGERKRETETAIRRTRGTWADRTRRVVARAHKLKPAPRRHCCLLRSTATLCRPFVPPVRHLVLSIHSSALRYVALCGVRLTNPTSPRSPPFAASSAARYPVTAALPLAAACPPTDPRNRSLPYHRSPPYVPTPPLPGRLQSSLSLAIPRACRPDSSSLCATMLSRSLLSSVPVAASPPPFSPLPLPCHTASRRPASPPSGNQHTRKPRALWNTTGSSTIIFRPIVCRACMRVCERRREKGRARAKERKRMMRARGQRFRRNIMERNRMEIVSDVLEKHDGKKNRTIFSCLFISSYI